MSNPETAVRVAAQALHLAIIEARKAGYVVQWPRQAEELPHISVSETASAQKPAPAAGSQARTETALSGLQIQKLIRSRQTGNPGHRTSVRGQGRRVGVAPPPTR